MSDVIVVGAGIIGSAIAYRLAQARASVTIIDAGDRVPTTATSFAWTNSNNKRPFAYHVLNVAGMAEHRALALEFEGEHFWHDTGNVEWAIDESEEGALREKVARLQSWGYPAELVDRDALCAIDPALVPPKGARAFAFFAAEGYVEAMPLAAALLRRAQELGARVQMGSVVASLAELKGKSSSVICTAGRWTGALLATIGFTLPMAPTRSCLATTSRTTTRLRTMLNSPAINIRSNGEGLLLQNTPTDLTGDEPSQTIPPERREELLLTRARRVVRGLDDVTIENVKLGIRSIPGDGLAVAGPVPGNEWVYVVCSHSGVTLAPFFARAVTRELLGGSKEARFAPFRLERFCKPATSR